MGISTKEWLNRKSKKLQKTKYRNRTARSYSSENTRTEETLFYSNEVYSAKAPELFSFFDNAEETISYFRGYIDEMIKRKFRERFFFDSINVQLVTVDVLTYIIALSKNIRYKKRYRFSIGGSIPTSEEPKRVFIESGFLRFFKTTTNQLPPNSERFFLVSGNRSNGVLAKEICEFVMHSLNKNIGFTQTLQNNLIEMMLNASAHAYGNDEIMNPVWYCCAEHTNNRVRITFLDTGMGIAKTVKKNFFEKAKIFVNDADLMYSAFSGDFRTSTNEDYRGNGLPSICESVINGYYDKFMVISGGGCCKATKTNGIYELTRVNFEHKIYGTIYILDIVA